MMPPGRFVSGVTQTSLGKVRAIGVCIPWFGSRTELRRGQERKLKWEDHAQYLDGLTKVLKQGFSEPTIAMGDLNQIVGTGSRAPSELQLALAGAFPARMRFITAHLDFRGRRSIDHIALSSELAATSVSAISNIQGERRLSDHFGVIAHLSRNE